MLLKEEKTEKGMMAEHTLGEQGDQEMCKMILDDPSQAPGSLVNSIKPMSICCDRLLLGNPRRCQKVPMKDEDDFSWGPGVTEESQNREPSLQRDREVLPSAQG